MSASLPPELRFGLGKEDAAAACGLTVGEFMQAVTRCELPAPRRFGRRLVWSAAALKRAIDGDEFEAACRSNADWLKLLRDGGDAPQER